MKYKLREGKNLRTGAAMFYAMAGPVSVIKLEKIAQEISQECTVTVHDIRAVISALEEKIIAHLQNGDSVRMGLLGSFRPTVKSQAARLPEEFSNANIKRITARFTESATMKYKLSADNPDVSFVRTDEEE